MYHFSSNLLEQQLKRRLLIIALVSMIPFVIIIAFGYFDWERITMVDYQISSYFYQLHSPMLNSVMTVVTHMGDLLVQTFVTVFVVITLFVLKKWRTAMWYGLTVLIGAGFLNGAIKELYGRARPNQIQPLVEIGGYSFPSGHSMGSIIVYGGILFLFFRFIRSIPLKIIISTVLSLMVLGIGISRVYLGVHFPTDVVGGFSLGAAWLFFSMALLGLKYTDREFRSKNRYSIKSL